MIKLILLALIAFGFFYSLFIIFYSFYPGFILMLTTIGFASTIYCLDKSVDRKIIFYVWIAIITIASLTLLVEIVFSLASFLRV